jgi:putative endonuclease
MLRFAQHDTAVGFLTKIHYIVFMKTHQYFIYITTSHKKTVLYTGVTNNLEQRLIEHYLNRGKPNTFAGKYFCYHLLYYEKFQWIQDAIAREKELKGWIRDKKLELIKTINPDFKFLNTEVCYKWPPEEDASLRST